MHWQNWHRHSGLTTTPTLTQGSNIFWMVYDPKDLALGYAGQKQQHDIFQLALGMIRR